MQRDAKTKVLTTKPDILVVTEGWLLKLLKNNLITLSSMDKMVFDHLNSMLHCGYDYEFHDIVKRLRHKHYVIAFTTTASSLAALDDKWKPLTVELGQPLQQVIYWPEADQGNSRLEWIVKYIERIPSDGARVKQTSDAVQQFLAAKARQKKFEQRPVLAFCSYKTVVGEGKIGSCAELSNTRTSQCFTVALTSTSVASAWPDSCVVGSKFWSQPGAPFMEPSSPFYQYYSSSRSRRPLTSSRV
jgi:superfamily II DNA/RNA helicase